MKKLVVLVCLVMIVVVMVSCTAGPNTLAKTPDEEGKVDGFWQGLWHGFISPVTFIISLFKHNMSIYEVHNNGGWYNFGFLFGASIILGSGGGAAGRSSR